MFKAQWVKVNECKDNREGNKKVPKKYQNKYNLTNKYNKILMNPSPIPHHQSPIKTKHPSLNFNLNKVDHKSSRDRLPRRGKIKIMSTTNKKEIAKMDRPSPSNFHLSTSISGKVAKNASKL